MSGKKSDRNRFRLFAYDDVGYKHEIGTYSSIDRAKDAADETRSVISSQDPLLFIPRWRLYEYVVEEIL